MSNDRHELPDGTRDSVIERYVMRALSAGAMTREGYADEVRRIYWAIVPEKARKVRFTDPETHPKPSTVLASNAKTVFRFWDDSVSARMPVAIEDAMAYALPDPYSKSCRQELAWRLGCRGSIRHTTDLAGCTASQADMSAAMGELLSIVARMQANDGVIDPKDKPYLADFKEAGLRLEANVHSLVTNIIDAVEGKTGERPTQLRSVS